MEESGLRRHSAVECRALAEAVAGAVEGKGTKLSRVERGEHRREVVRKSCVAVQKHDGAALAARDEVQAHALDLDELARLNLPRQLCRTPYHKRTPLHPSQNFKNDRARKESGQNRLLQA